MRMWLIDPELMCRNHLLGEHLECHMLVGCILREKTLGRFLTDGLVDPEQVQGRHDALVEEMLRRGYNHKSPLPKHRYDGLPGCVDPQKNLVDLADRCPSCKQRIESAR